MAVVGGKKGPKPKALAVRFWSKVRKTKGHWFWTGYRDKNGYGHMYMSRGKYTVAHRVAWILVKGPLAKGMCALHSCDTPSCVRPSHLFKGTRPDNSRDMAIKERSRTTILTASQVMKIRAEYKIGKVTHLMLAEKYGVTRSAIKGIMSHRTWKHLP